MATESENYNIILTGEVAEGFDVEEVKSQIEERLKIKKDKIDLIFKKKNVRIQKGLAKEKAAKYKRAFEQCGAIVKVTKTAVPQAEKEEKKETVITEPTAKAAQVEEKKPTILSDLKDKVGIEELKGSLEKILDKTPWDNLSAPMKYRVIGAAGVFAMIILALTFMGGGNSYAVMEYETEEQALLCNRVFENIQSTVEYAIGENELNNNLFAVSYSAAKSDCVNEVNFMINEAGMDVNYIGSGGRTLLDNAIDNNATNMIALLEEKGAESPYTDSLIALKEQQKRDAERREQELLAIQKERERKSAEKAAKKAEEAAKKEANRLAKIEKEKERKAQIAKREADAKEQARIESLAPCDYLKEFVSTDSARKSFQRMVSNNCMSEFNNVVAKLKEEGVDKFPKIYWIRNGKRHDAEAAYYAVAKGYTELASNIIKDPFFKTEQALELLKSRSTWSSISDTEEKTLVNYIKVGALKKDDATARTFVKQMTFDGNPNLISVFQNSGYEYQSDSKAIGFKAYRLGDELSIYQKSPAFVCEDPVIKGFTYCYPNKTNQNFSTLFEKKIKGTQLIFVDGLLSTIHLEFEAWEGDYDYVRERFNERFGEPKSLTEKQVQYGIDGKYTVRMDKNVPREKISVGGVYSFLFSKRTRIANMVYMSVDSSSSKEPSLAKRHASIKRENTKNENMNATFGKGKKPDSFMGMKLGGFVSSSLREQYGFRCSNEQAPVMRDQDEFEICRFKPLAKFVDVDVDYGRAFLHDGKLVKVTLELRSNYTLWEDRFEEAARGPIAERYGNPEILKDGWTKTPYWWHVTKDETSRFSRGEHSDYTYRTIGFYWDFGEIDLVIGDNTFQAPGVAEGAMFAYSEKLKVYRSRDNGATGIITMVHKPLHDIAASVYADKFIELTLAANLAATEDKKAKDEAIRKEQEAADKKARQDF